MRYKTVPGIVLTSVCGDFFLVSPKITVCINDTAVFYWRKLQKGADEEELASSAIRYYEVEDPDTLYSDIETILRSFLEMRLITRCDE